MQNDWIAKLSIRVKWGIYIHTQNVFCLHYSLFVQHLFKLLLSATERQICREKLGEMLGERVITIADLMNRHDYVPKMPNQTELDLIFDTSLPDVQPYLFRVCWQSVFRTVVFNWPYARDENQVFWLVFPTLTLVMICSVLFTKWRITW